MIELSVIIPTYNRAEQLRACLQSLCQQTQPYEDFEVIVVVDGSTDGTDTMLANLSTPYVLQVLSQPNSGAGATRNLGVKHARGRYCLFLDDDVRANAQLVAEHLCAQRAHGGAVVIGRATMVLPDNADWFAHCYAREWTLHYDQLGTGALIPTWMDCYTNNLSVPRDAMLDIGGFATDLRRNEDIELAYRLQQCGLKVVCLPTELVILDERKGFPALSTDFENGGAAAYEMYRRHPELLPYQMGTFGGTTRRDITLRRILLALNMPLRPLDWFGRLIARTHWVWLWYLFVCKYSYWRGVKRAVHDTDTWQRLTSGTVIVMYHAFAKPGEPTSRYIISARRFAQQMAWLRLLRYNVLSLEEYLQYRHAYRLPPARSVVITSDDGYADNYTIAYPILRKHRIPATIFLVSQAIDRCNNRWDGAVEAHLDQRPVLSHGQILEMQRQGTRFGAHTRMHPVLTNLSESEACAEIAGSRADLEALLGEPVRTFAYSYGKQNEKIQRLAEGAGFLGACGVEGGKNYASTPLFNLHRVEIKGHYTLLDFVTSVWLGGHR